MKKMNTPKVRKKQLNTKLCNYALKNNTKLCIHLKKTTAKLSLALFLGISYFLFFLNSKIQQIKTKNAYPKTRS